MRAVPVQMTPRLVLFDCDGTLVDSQHMIVTAMTATFAAAGLAPPPRQAILATVGLSLMETMMQLAPEAPPEEHAALASAYRAAFRDLRSRSAEPMFPGARDTLLSLSGDGRTLLGIATGKSRRGVDALLTREGLSALFCTIQTADDAPSKPHPGMILNALAETGVPAANTVIVGDSTYDMLMARSAGIRAIGVSWGYHPPAGLLAAGAEIIVEDYAALSRALETLFGDVE